MPKFWALGAALAALTGWAFVATAVEPPDEYAKLIQQHSRVSTLDGGFFGDHVGLSTGNLEFTQTDVSLPGNDALAVRVGRRFQVGNWPAKGHFSDWDLDIPHLHGIFGGATSSTVAWEVNNDDPDHRCSEFNTPPEIFTLGGAIYSPDEYWHGTFLYLPGSGDQELLYGGDVPTSGGPYYATTREGAAARCLTTLASTSEAGSTGEGFEVVTPDGTVYTFNQMVSRDVDDLNKPDPTPLLQARGGARKRPTSAILPRDAQGSGTSTDSIPCCIMQRKEFFLYPTKVTDRFGNTVTYTWDSSNPWRLLSIVGSDQRTLNLTYSSSDTTSRLIQTVNDGLGGHTWTYTYAGSIPDVTLASVTQPDLHAWTFSLLPLHRNAKPTPNGVSCDAIRTPGGTPWTGSITAPSGATAQYTMTAVMFGRSWAFRDCKVSSEGAESITEPYLFVNVSITGKKITGPGLPTDGLTWTYSYGSPNNCWEPSGVPSGDADAIACTSGSPTSRTTTVTEPDGTQSRYTFGNKYGYYTIQVGNEGLLLGEEHGVSGSTVLRTTTMQYADGNATPYGSHQGNSLRRRGDWTITSQRRPQFSVVTTLQGASFSWTVPQACGGAYCFDTRARPTTIVRSGPNAVARTETTTYHDDTALWILGQVEQVKCIAPTGTGPNTCGPSGTVMSATTFDSATALPLTTSAFGKLKNTFTYDTSSAVNTGQRGTLLTVADGNGNTTTYTSWKRGIPRSVHFPASLPDYPSGNTRTAVVNDSGWIDSVTDENGYQTNYLYDDMGRIKKVTHPTGDTPGWATTDSVFEPATGAENGVPLGHWHEVVSTGNARKVTVFDALWRPVLVREYDNANITGTDRYVATAYDRAGRVVDASYPLGSSPGTTLALATTATTATWGLGSGGPRPAGVRTMYDALGRPLLVQQDSELGVLNTVTDYLSTFQRRVTDARGNATTEQFMAWDSPSFDLPVQVDAPEHQRTTIARDIFGKPTAITRQEVSP